MSTSGRLWFHIERVFSQIESMCAEARAADLLKKRREEDEEAGILLGAPRKSIIFDEAKERFPQAQDLLRDATFRETHAQGADLVALRGEIRKRLVWLKARLAEVLTEREVYYSLFPLVIYADELVFAVADDRAATYEPLQSELYGIDNGGELFYTIIEDLLRKEETLPIIFEIFYFCLSDGFLGLYENDPPKREEYKNRLAFRIPVTLPPKVSGVDRVLEHTVRLVPFPKGYYIGAAVAVVVGFALFRMLGLVEVAMQ